MSWRSDRGSTTVEMLVLVPAVALLFGLVVTAGRLQSTQADLDAAARSSARTISLQRDPVAAESVARDEAGRVLGVGGPSCRSLDFTPVVTPELVTVTLACTVDLSGASLLPLPGSLRLESSSTEPIDHYKEQP